MDSNTELARDYSPKPECDICGKSYLSHRQMYGLRVCPVVAFSYRPKKAALTQQPAEQIADGALGVTQRDREAALYVGHLTEERGLIVAEAFARHAQQARAQALEEAAKVAECAFDDRPNSRAGHHSEMDWTDGFRDGTKVAASAIRALQPHGQGGGPPPIGDE